MKVLVKVMISSTSDDLERCRETAIEVCDLLDGIEPIPMERFGPETCKSVELCLRKVEEADIFLGIIAHRYGSIPEGEERSFTEIEYDRAMALGKPVYVFMVDEQVPWRPDLFDRGVLEQKLRAFKEKVLKNHSVQKFSNCKDSRDQLLILLPRWRDRLLQRGIEEEDLHRIVAPPHPYVALSPIPQTKTVSRRNELDLLTGWLTNAGGARRSARVFSVVAMGGMGKSTLTWEWFDEVVPREAGPLAGRLWWSFYQRDVDFEDFVICALAYVSRQPKRAIKSLPMHDREERLLEILREKPFLIVLDGLERAMELYAREDTSPLPHSDKDSEVELTPRHPTRQMRDPRLGEFLQKLALPGQTRTLISTRLYPAELETETGRAMLGSYRHDLGGLSDEEALELWESLGLGVGGWREILLETFNNCGNHPLLIRVLAGLVARHPDAPGDFEQWLRAHSELRSFLESVVPSLWQKRTHILDQGLSGLKQSAHNLLYIIAAFRTPVSYATLAALMTDEGKSPSGKGQLGETLADLEDRGLLGWDRDANCYDMHPVTRWVVWNRVSVSWLELRAKPRVSSIEELTPAIKLYENLVALKFYEDAMRLFLSRLERPLLYRLSANRRRVELLEQLFPAGPRQPPSLERLRDRAFILADLANAYTIDGQPRRAAPLYRDAIAIIEKEGKRIYLCTTLHKMVAALRQSGGLREAEGGAYRALLITREGANSKLAFEEGVTLRILGISLAMRDEVEKAKAAFDRASRIFAVQGRAYDGELVKALRVQAALWWGDAVAVDLLSSRAWESAHPERVDRDRIRAIRLQGELSLALGDVRQAEEHLNAALQRAKEASLAKEVLAAAVGLAELRRREGEHEKARGLLEGVWAAAERGPYPLHHADAYNVLALVERDSGNKSAAVEAAMRAYRLACCDGRPFTYHWGVEKARGLLRELGAEEPEMPECEETKFEPMPVVEINPPDEFWAEGDDGQDKG